MPPRRLNQRLVGLDAEAISRIPVRIGVAAGAEKMAAVRAALLGRFVTVLVVDEAIAEQLAVEREKEELMRIPKT